jgi:hypothetical protein
MISRGLTLQAGTGILNDRLLRGCTGARHCDQSWLMRLTGCTDGWGGPGKPRELYA